jgi:DNA-binding transcriptional ArsR family regulator
MDGHTLSARILKALGHPTRLQILEVLSLEGESCVCHLECRLGLRQAYISQQLARLRDAGIVTDRRVGLNVFYRLANPLIGPLLTMGRETAIAFAKVQEDDLTFQDLQEDPSSPCPCPKCRQKLPVKAGLSHVSS